MAREAPDDIRPRLTRSWSVGVYSCIVTIVCALDQLAKTLARASLASGRPVELVSGILSLNLVANDGAAFGILRGHAPALVACAAVVIVACVTRLVTGRCRSRLEAASLGLVSAGALGNVIDRVVCGYVTDFIQVTFVSFPVFNVADIAITCGFVLFMLALLTSRDAGVPVRAHKGGDDA